MASEQGPKHPALRAVYWREEIIEVVLWLRGEGLDERLSADELCTFLDVDRDTAAAHLNRLADQGYLDRLVDGRYVLTAEGENEGRRIIGTPRAVPPPVVGACGDDCWCATSPVEASRCGGLRSTPPSCLGW